jgi:hypothetical protein
MDVWWTARRRCGGRPWTRTRLRGWARRDRRHAARRGGAGYRRRRRPAGWLAGRTSARHTEEQCDGEHHPQSGNHEDGTLPAGARFRLRRPTLGPGSSTMPRSLQELAGLAPPRISRPSSPAASTATGSKCSAVQLVLSSGSQLIAVNSSASASNCCWRLAAKTNQRVTSVWLSCPRVCVTDRNSGPVAVNLATARVRRRKIPTD